MREARWNPLREPVVHFALGALVILALDRYAAHRRAPPPSRPRIVVTAEALASLRAAFEAQRHQRATADEERAMLDEFVRDEALAREALARRLDVGDPVIRRRLVQKMQFLLDAQPVDEPDDATLTRWLDAHRDEFRRAPSTSFEALLFSRERRGDRAEPDARDALAAIAPDEPVAHALTRADPSLRGVSFRTLRFADVTSMFGYDLARGLETLPLARWAGPIESPAGWYVVRVTARDPGGVALLSEVRAEVRRRYVEERRAALAREATERLVRGYEVVR